MEGHNGQLKAIVERIGDRQRTKIKELSEDRSDIFSEAKGNGFDVKALRKVLALRKLSADDRALRMRFLRTYLHALGMV